VPPSWMAYDPCIVSSLIIFASVTSLTLQPSKVFDVAKWKVILVSIFLYHDRWLILLGRCVEVSKCLTRYGRQRPSPTQLCRSDHICVSKLRILPNLGNRVELDVHSICADSCVLLSHAHYIKGPPLWRMKNADRVFQNFSRVSWRLTFRG